MRSRWSEAATALVDELRQQGVSQDLALRVYTSRLLGAERTLVRHGGGNTSVKTTERDVLGREIKVICVKGSGYDLDAMPPRGLPAMCLEPLLELRRVERLTDESIVVALRSALTDPTSPTPSVESLLHAWILERYVDHTHADPVLALTDQPDGAALCREVFGPRMTVAPYVMPGFALAHQAARAYAANPAAWGLILLNHGIFTWGTEAHITYERMIEMVDLAERRIQRAKAGSSPVFAAPTIVSRPTPKLAEVAPRVRGALAEHGPAVLAFRSSKAILDYLAGQELERYANARPVNPDHVIRTKPKHSLGGQRRRSRRPLPDPVRRRALRDGVLVTRAGQTRHGRAQAAGRKDRRDHRRGRRHRGSDGAGVRGRGSRGRAARP